VPHIDFHKKAELKKIKTYNMIKIDGFNIIDISVRTSNRNNQSAQDLAKLWGEFYEKGLLDKIPNKVSNDIYSIYTDYKSDFTDEYTTVIGMQVTSLEDIPAGLIGRQFSSDNFIRLVAKGSMPKAIVDVWMDVWNRDKELNRKYSYDFEVYGDKSQNGEDSEVDIYIAVH
jgi:predicted transcriptional regulator YdeE